MRFSREIEQSVAYLKSEQAARTVATDSYWPKWHAPWWHMLLLHEMGQTSLIPESIVSSYIDSLNRMPLKIFPIHPEDLPADIDPACGTPCHCQLGNVYQVLAARGVDVDQELPWIRPWFLRYQMADGGLNCDNDAYLVTGECPSSMVGTIAAFEAVLLYTPRPWTTEEKTFLEKGAQFLTGRELRHGSQTKHNAAEQQSAEAWDKLCFPRFYLYDVLRGLNALTQWAEKTGAALPKAACLHIAQQLEQQFGDGAVRIGRRIFEGARTIVPTENGERLRADATSFPLLEAVSAVGDESPFLSELWLACRRRLAGS